MHGSTWIFWVNLDILGQPNTFLAHAAGVTAADVNPDPCPNADLSGSSTTASRRCGDIVVEGSAGTVSVCDFVAATGLTPATFTCTGAQFPFLYARRWQV